MKRLRLPLLGIGAFLLALLIVLPVRWVAPLLPPAVRCTAWQGSVWRGQCNGLEVAATPQPVQLDELRWRLQPLALLRLSLAAQVQLSGSAGSAEGHVERRAGGALLLRDVALRARVNRQLLGVLPAGWQGQLETSALALRLDGNTLHELAGAIVLRELVDGRGQQLGSYRLTFPAGSAAPWTGALQDDSGPFEVRARLVVQADRSWAMDGTVLPRDAAGRAFEPQLQLLGPRDASGRYRLSVSGNFR